jgi:uncharacterized membrane protein YdbT with pleckstrin-like domain
MIKEKEVVYWHGKLPIGKDERIIGIYRHHWFVYAEIWLIALFVILGIMTVSVFAASSASTTSDVLSPYRPAIIASALLFSTLAALFTAIPAWLKSKERIVLTEEALLQVLQPGLFSSKISQLNLQHVADVTAQQDFLGHIFGFGKITIETPGEQMNYVFTKLAEPQSIAREIIEAHENYDAALESGRIPTTYGNATAVDPRQTINEKEFAEFMAYKNAMSEREQKTPDPTPDPSSPKQ